VGRLDQYAKEIFDTETPVVTRGAAFWQPPSEISLTEVRLDGRIFVRDPALLATLPLPWADAGASDEIIFETKMQGDHVDLRASERACLRRQARQVQRMEDPGAPWDGDLPLWMLASRVPAILRQRRTFRKIGDGCYRVETGAYPYLWIAANELPLQEELIPFLIARTGGALDELGRWIRGRRSPDWISRMVEYLPMSTAVHDELLRFALEKPEDEAMRARQELTARVYLELTPKVKAEAVAEAVRETRLEDARSVLRRVLALRKLALAPDDEARIDACADTATLECWHDQAMVASTTAEALRS
jgi:hypothetical protein